MSRAFTREIDDAPPPPLAERPVSSARNLVTRSGARQIEETIERLAQRIEAETDPDLLSGWKRDLRYWRTRFLSMERVDPVDRPQVVRFGTTVTFERTGMRKAVRIVGEDEADPAAGAIAWTSPLARALEGAAPGDMVEFAAAGREDDITIIAVSGGEG